MIKCKQCSKNICKLTNKFYRKYGTAISFNVKAEKIETDLAFCSIKCVEMYKEAN